MKIERLKIRRKWKNKITVVRASFFSKMYFNQIHMQLIPSLFPTGYE